ncbi:glycerophosphodiester phosphodiesterase GDPD4 isoform X1 [Phoenix dactylifera]|uniref:glycerophosphodiester phosphodiesterase n=1 Tax=Phoenix dactylifera TaxID=42345 RepID=A0A8B7CAX0_PHODC|nr:glycerophosphodiester phosphodiesterase GDPD4 isoform X1 [Phoenix dactylifera]
MRGGLLPSSRRRQRFPRFASKGLLRLLLLLAFLAVIPPIFFHFRLPRFNQIRSRKCGWLKDPPLVCAHGGDSSKAAPNTMEAYRIALDSRVDCVEIDVSRSSDGVLFALHDRDLQRMSGNSSAKVGYLSKNEIKELDAGFQLSQKFQKQEVPTVEDALVLISNSVRQVILDAKVGPPSYEKGLAKDILSVVKKTRCKNCLIWAKSDIVGRDVIKLSKDVTVGYTVMKDPSTGARSDLLRMKGAAVAGVYHSLIDWELMRILHGRGKKVYAWTVDDAESMKRMLLERVDAIVTGNPSLLQGLMQGMKTECLEEGSALP